jgi:hypothetical protein
VAGEGGGEVVVMQWGSAMEREYQLKKKTHTSVRKLLQNL